MMGETLCYDSTGSLVLFIVSERSPDRDEWRSYVDFLRDRIAEHTKTRLVVIAGSGAPDAVQRKQLTDAVSPKQLRTAVVSDSLVARGVVTAFRWAGMEVDAFKGSEVEAAYRFVNATREELEWLRSTAASMRAALRTPQAASR